MFYAPFSISPTGKGGPPDLGNGASIPRSGDDLTTAQNTSDCGESQQNPLWIFEHTLPRKYVKVCCPMKLGIE